MIKLSHEIGNKTHFIINEEPVFIEKNNQPEISMCPEGNLNNDREIIDLIKEIKPLLISHKTPEKTVYRLQHTMVTDTEELIIAILPILDSFENLLELANRFSKDETLQNWLKTIEAIYKKLKITLSKYALQPVISIGVPVDFNVHEVVEYRYIPDGIPNIIIEEKQKGYMLKGKLIREARVVVVNTEEGG